MIEKFLKDNYGNSHYKGFKYISYVANNNILINNIMKIYREISLYYKVTEDSVERAIRNYKEKSGYKNICNNEFINNIIIEYNYYKKEK